MKDTVLFNGHWIEADSPVFSSQHRASLYGDGLFETLRSHSTDGVRFFESHYFRLMASLRILRMEIPSEWSPEFLLDHLLDVTKKRAVNSRDVRLRLSVWRHGSTGYGSHANGVDWCISGTPLDSTEYRETADSPRILVFKDHAKPPGLLSTLKGPHSFLFGLAERFAKENQATEALILTPDNHLLESSRSNLFILQDGQLYTPPLSAGCTKGVLRQAVLKTAKELGVPVIEKCMSPFDLQRADEVWLSNAVHGIRPVREYKQAHYSLGKANEFLSFIEEESKIFSL